MFKVSGTSSGDKYFKIDMKRLVKISLILGLLLVSVPYYRTEIFLFPKKVIEEVAEELSIRVTATCYMPNKEQCDSVFHITASGRHIDLDDPIKHRWIAVSRDLRKKYFRFGDTVYVSGTRVYDGYWVVNDVMAPYHRNKIDFLIGDRNVCRTWHNVKIIINNR